MASLDVEHGSSHSMIRVAVTGSECTGKTTLATDLAAHYDVTAVPEYARRFVDEQGRAPVAADVETIARGQIALQDEVLASGPAILIQDTDLLSTVVYARHYYGACPGWVEEAALERRADLYLLVGLDVPWVADGAMRDRGGRREEMQDLFRRALVDRQWPHVELQGDPQARRALAISAVDRLSSL